MEHIQRSPRKSSQSLDDLNPPFRQGSRRSHGGQKSTWGRHARASRHLEAMHGIQKTARSLKMRPSVALPFSRDGIMVRKLWKPSRLESENSF